jgi:hypothetical protein
VFNALNFAIDSFKASEWPVSGYQTARLFFSVIKSTPARVQASPALGLLRTVILRKEGNVSKEHLPFLLPSLTTALSFHTMRLPNTKEIIVKSFPSPARPEIPDYVILSHRWRNQEISFQDIQHCKAGDITEGLKHIEGFDKILHCCQEAQSVGIKYAWVDTCCINKTDQVELTEALNSMFRWYGKAQVCYAYMSDVPSDEEPLAEGLQVPAERVVYSGLDASGTGRAATPDLLRERLGRNRNKI